MAGSFQARTLPNFVWSPYNTFQRMPLASEIQVRRGQLQKGLLLKERREVRRRPVGLRRRPAPWSMLPEEGEVDEGKQTKIDVQREHRPGLIPTAKVSFFSCAWRILETGDV